jgi:hypothetical protein
MKDYDPWIYKCDPEKNSECRKTGCQRECFHTLHKEYSKDGKQYRFQQGELRERGEINGDI